MKQNPLKTLTLLILIVCSGKLKAQNELLSLNTAPAINTKSYAADDILVISDFKSMAESRKNMPVVTVRSTNAATMHVRIFTMNGELEKEESRMIDDGMNDVEVDMSDLSAGVYMVQFYTKDGSALRRFLKAQ